MASSSSSKTLKFIVIGDGAVGKTCLLISALTNKYPDEYVPTVFDNYAAEMQGEDGKTYTVGYWDTAGGEDYYVLRPLSYPDTDTFLICFDVNNRSSFENIEEYWIPELDQLCPEVPRLIVGCKADLRMTNGEDTLVAYSEGVEVARRVGGTYVETSAKEYKGLEECFKTGIRLAVAGFRPPYKKRTKNMEQYYKNRRAFVQLQYRIHRPRTPKVVVEPTTFTDQWHEALLESLHTDVLFEIESTKHQAQAHKVILCSASDFFNKLLENHHELPDVVQSVSQISDECGRRLTQINLSKNVQPQELTFLLNFIYTGDPGFPDDFPLADLNPIIDLSRRFGLELLEAFCENMRSGREPEYNLSLTTYEAELLGRRLGERYLNKPKDADVIFNCQDQQIYGHRSVLAVRSEVMSIMFSGDFKEGTGSHTEISIEDTSPETFLLLLEYLYTDRVSLNPTNTVDLLSLADRYCENRLRDIIQLQITHHISEHGNQDLQLAIDMLKVSSIYNAPKLQDWCFHFMSVNYQRYKDFKSFNKLSGRDQYRVRDNQWPPQWQLDEDERVRQEAARNRLVLKVKNKCSIM